MVDPDTDAERVDGTSLDGSVKLEGVSKQSTNARSKTQMEESKRKRSVNKGKLTPEPTSKDPLDAEEEAAKLQAAAAKEIKLAADDAEASQKRRAGQKQKEQHARQIESQHAADADAARLKTLATETHTRALFLEALKKNSKVTVVNPK
jgi:hypothetical protein